MKRELDPPPAFRSARTTTWRPEIDVAIDASGFDFTPPGEDA